MNAFAPSPDKGSPQVLLINPSYNKTEALGPFARYITSQLPLSIGFLAGYLLHHGIRVDILDEQLETASASEIGARLSSRPVRIIGLSVLTLTAARAYELGALIKRTWPDITVVMGGIHVTLLPDEPLQKGVTDIVVRNEGEITLYEIALRVLRGESWHDVEGISFLRDGAVIHNASRSLIDDLDSLPPFPYHLFEEDKDRYQFGNMITSRGCPYECIFCSQRAISGRKYRSRSPEKIVAEMETLVNRYGQDFIFMNDDNFLVNKRKIHELCDLIIAKRFPAGFKLGFHGRGDAMDRDLLLHMRRAHFTTVLIGLETGSERVMQMVKKGETVAEILQGAKIAKEAGFVVGGQFILGFPTETKQESRQTIRHALGMPIDFVRFNLLVPYPGTEVFELMQKSGGLRNPDWTSFATHGGLTGKSLPYVPEGRTERELILLQWIGHLLFYFRPRQIFNLRNMKYAMANQLLVPEPTSFKGIAELALFFVRLMTYMMKGLWKRS